MHNSYVSYKLHLVSYPSAIHNYVIARRMFCFAIILGYSMLTAMFISV